MNGNHNLKNSKLVNIRVFAIILVVLAHSIIIYNPYWGIYKSDVQCNFFKYLCLFIYIFHMPLFFSLSGYLFDKTFKKNKSFKLFALKKTRRLLIPYLFIGVVWLFPIRWLVGYKNYSNNSLAYNIFINVLFGKDNGHLWFLITLFTIFIIYYIIRKYINDRKKICIIVLILSFLGYFIPTFVGKALQNLIWFYLGNCIEENELEKKLEKASNIRIVSVLMLIVLITLYLFLDGRIAYYEYICLFIQYIVCIIIIPLIYCSMPNKTTKICEIIDENSFGIYLFNSPLIYITYSTSIINYPILTFIINFFIFGFLAYIITIILKKTRLRFLIGC